MNPIECEFVTIADNNNDLGSNSLDLVTFSPVIFAD